MCHTVSGVPAQVPLLRSGCAQVMPGSWDPAEQLDICHSWLQGGCTQPSTRGELVSDGQSPARPCGQHLPAPLGFPERCKPSRKQPRVTA